VLTEESQAHPRVTDSPRNLMFKTSSQKFDSPIKTPEEPFSSQNSQELLKDHSVINSKVSQLEQENKKMVEQMETLEQ
jgi:hypothetical protein